MAYIRLNRVRLSPQFLSCHVLHGNCFSAGGVVFYGGAKTCLEKQPVSFLVLLRDISQVRFCTWNSSIVEGSELERISRGVVTYLCGGRSKIERAEEELREDSSYMNWMI
uniref:Uncharacterized protein n=1 Tax=Setaria digitata TaxID=48799 RepID=A0A915Q1P6_9BILA